MAVSGSLCGRILTGLLSVVLYAGASLAAWQEDPILTASDAGNNDGMGMAVAITRDGSRVAVGVPLSGTNDEGAVYVFSRTGSGWDSGEKLTALDGWDQYNFGTAVALCGTSLFVGASGYDSPTVDNIGAVHVFEYVGATNRWYQTQTLTAPTPVANMYFGKSVAASADGTTLAVGVPHNAAAQGQVYVYAYDGLQWVYDDSAVAGDGAANDGLGTSVSISDDGATVVAGAPTRDASLGGVYVFTYGAGPGLMQTQKLTRPASSPGLFGASVAVSGDGYRFLIGACTNRGAAYIFEWVDASSDWQEHDVLTPVVPVDGDNFGFSVTLAGTAAFVGAMGRTANRGSAFVFTYDGANWAEDDELFPASASGGDAFGRSIAAAASGRLLVAGMPGDDGGGVDRGSAVVFRLPSPPAGDGGCVPAGAGHAALAAWMVCAVAVLALVRSGSVRA